MLTKLPALELKKRVMRYSSVFKRYPCRRFDRDDRCHWHRQNALNSHFQAHWEQMLTFRGNGKRIPAGKSLTAGDRWTVLAGAVARCDSRPPLISAVTLTRNFCDGHVCKRIYIARKILTKPLIISLVPHSFGRNGTEGTTIDTGCGSWCP
jgi:hypothetical protein